ncbi:GAF and ANTAR domain-containing protein [Streptomyces sp. NBC_01264]|uniref:GAF and ANTAR domain-containing protein n=1 Tax=Streptomyces sp. NBC_01264 TaxID=2903804 RepID=UPI00224F6BF3|nr:GAF and ANTAR domain-containing protein [Streptomyces sp. NBC_01264]MCX4783463.1 GAF and ANTAR domain-containing protein [Streptomyces sp. NBC_01264]
MTREQHVTQVFVEVADSLIDDFDLIDFLQQLSVRCMELLDVAAVGIMLADQHEVLQTMAASDEHTRLLELFATQHDQGPCVDCYKSGEPRTNINLSDPQITSGWPQFAPRAAETGFVTANAIPLRLRGRVIGVMGLFQTDPDPLSAQDIALAQALADVATIAILQQRTVAHSEVERVQLQHALTSRIVLEQVKGILAERWQVTVDEAFAAFRSYARAHHHQLAQLARQIADGTFETTQIPHPDRSRPQA